MSGNNEIKAGGRRSSRSAPPPDAPGHGRGPGGPGGHGSPGGPRGPGGMMMGGGRAKNFKRSMRSLFSYCWKYLPAIGIALLLGVAGSIFNVIGPDKLKEITDLITVGLISEVDLDAVTNVAIFLTVLYVSGFVFNYMQGFIMATVTQRITKRLRTEISDKINRLPFAYFNKTSTGDVLSRVTNDVDMIGQTLNNSLGTLITALTTFVGAIIMMFYTNWIMAVSGIFATFIGFAFMSVIMSRSQKYFMAQQQELGRINGHVEETYSGHHIIKAYNGEQEAIRTFDEINEKLYHNAWKSQFMSGLMMPFMGFVGNFGYVVVCIVGALLALNGHTSFGTIVAFMVYIRLFTNPLTQFAQVGTNLQTTAAAAERVFEFLEEQEMDDEKEKTTVLSPADVKGEVEFRNVRFGYTEDRTVIKNFSALAKPGQKIAIVGPTGAGKTTIVNLLMRFYEVNDGDILIDGVSIRQLTRKNVHELFCMVLQDTWIFEGTIRENIVYSKEGVTDEEVEAACRAVGLHHFIRSLPNGYDTVLDDKANLSAGQKQLITIARAMVENAPMLILDEATSSVDTRTEVLIQEAMDKLMAGRTSFVIAHRLSTIRNADLILVMKDGDIIESGTHTELLAKGGFYADLYNSQFEQVS
jgi:ATP-binding cassette subfamily B protein